MLNQSASQNFNPEEQLKAALKHSQNMYFECENLIMRLSGIINLLDDSISIVFNNIIDLYNEKIEGDSEAIFTIDVEFARFKQMKALKAEFENILLKSKKEEK